MDGQTARKAGRRSRGPREAETPEQRRGELIELLGGGLARVIERSPAIDEELLDSDRTRVELPGEPRLSVSPRGDRPRDGGS